MDIEKLGKLVGASVASGMPLTTEAVESVLTNEELLAAAQRRGLLAEASGSLAVTEVAAVETTPVAEAEPTPERVVLTAESLLATFDTAYQTYSWQVAIANAARGEVKGRKKPEQLTAVDADTIRTDLEAILANETVVAELQAEIDHFMANPETDSPTPGFDVVIVPEGLTTADEQVLARDLQVGIKDALGTSYATPYIRPEAYNDKRTPAVTGKGYRIAFAPRHYNVPSGTTANQTTWLRDRNQTTSATELQTATDAEALAQINNLLENDLLPKGSGYDVNRFHRTYFRRFDQAPRDDHVSNVCVYGDGKLNLDGSDVHNDRSARALVVPKA